MDTTSFPPPVTHELEGWTLFWADLEAAPAADAALEGLRRRTSVAARERYGAAPLSEHPTVAALRRLFRDAGTDPTRYRPSSEALLRRIVKGEDIPAINAFVDVNNCLSALLAVPVCVMDRDRLAPPFVFRAGRPGESMLSLRGPFNLEGRPVLTDARGPCDAPITGGDRVKVREGTTSVWLVAYLPAATVAASVADETLRGLLQAAPVAILRGTGASGAS